ncbi:MAG: DUF5372 family protein, partial [Anaerolineaceae bacterium]|nr:DUF5372 family protein [Anaerolineaceae bacterium]
CYRSPNANSAEESRQPSAMVRVTHPFHPWSGRVFLLLGSVTTGSVALVRCVVDEERVRSLPVAWTDRRRVDDFERMSAGYSLFRADDLEVLRAQVDVLLDDQK